MCRLSPISPGGRVLFEGAGGKLSLLLLLFPPVVAASELRYVVENSGSRSTASSPGLDTSFLHSRYRSPTFGSRSKR